MIVQIKVPDFGVTMDTVTIHKWLIAEGDEIVRGQTIAELEGDKAVVILESVATGVLLKIVAAEGVQVSTGDVIAFAGEPTDKVPQSRDAAPESAGRHSSPATSRAPCSRQATFVSDSKEFRQSERC